MSAFTIFAFLFLLFAWTRALKRFRAGLMSMREFFFWTLVWGGAALVIYKPSLTGAWAEKIGIGRGSDVIIYVSILVIFYLLFRLYAYIGGIEREITRLVRALSLKEATEQKKK